MAITPLHPIYKPPQLKKHFLFCQTPVHTATCQNGRKYSLHFWGSPGKGGGQYKGGRFLLQKLGHLVDSFSTSRRTSSEKKWNRWCPLTSWWSVQLKNFDTNHELSLLSTCATRFFNGIHKLERIINQRRLLSLQRTWKENNERRLLSLSPLVRRLFHRKRTHPNPARWKLPWHSLSKATIQELNELAKEGTNLSWESLQKDNHSNSNSEYCNIWALQCSLIWWCWCTPARFFCTESVDIYA